MGNTAMPSFNSDGSIHESGVAPEAPAPEPQPAKPRRAPKAKKRTAEAQRPDVETR